MTSVWIQQNVGRKLLKLSNREPMKNTAASPCIFVFRLCTSGKIWLLGLTKGSDLDFLLKMAFCKVEIKCEMKCIFKVYFSPLPVRSPIVIHMV